jgi:NitT/TauT family transport system substrate-binding protein
VSTLKARIANWKLEKSGVTSWGESSLDHYQAYLDFLVKWGQIKQPIKAGEVVTNALVADINAFDPKAIAAAAASYK